MSTPDLHQRFDELAVGHALGALEPGDEQDFLRHAASCARCDRAVSRPGVADLHLDERLEPVEAARAVANDFYVLAAAHGLGGYNSGHGVGAERPRRGVGRYENFDRRRHAVTSRSRRAARA